MKMVEAVVKILVTTMIVTTATRMITSLHVLCICCSEDTTKEESSARVAAALSQTDRDTDSVGENTARTGSMALGMVLSSL